MRLVEYDTCSCGARKKIVSKTCRFCYLKHPNKNETSKINTKRCLTCNGILFSLSKNCVRCFRKNRKELSLNRTIESVIGNRKGTPNAYVHIRVLARKIMLNSNIVRKCKKCTYDKHVEVCHIKPINSFAITALIKEVNALENMIYLCPNCHWEFDEGLWNLN